MHQQERWIEFGWQHMEYVDHNAFEPHNKLMIEYNNWIELISPTISNRLIKNCSSSKIQFEAASLKS